MECNKTHVEVFPDNYVGPYASVTIHVREKHAKDIGVLCLQDYIECRLITLDTNNRLAEQALKEN